MPISFIRELSRDFFSSNTIEEANHFFQLLLLKVLSQYTCQLVILKDIPTEVANIRVLWQQPVTVPKFFNKRDQGSRPSVDHFTKGTVGAHLEKGFRKRIVVDVSTGQRLSHV